MKTSCPATIYSQVRIELNVANMTEVHRVMQRTILWCETLTGVFHFNEESCPAYEEWKQICNEAEEVLGQQCEVGEVKYHQSQVSSLAWHISSLSSCQQCRMTRKRAYLRIPWFGFRRAANGS